jgi:hypothetical protein
MGHVCCNNYIIITKHTSIFKISFSTAWTSTRWCQHTIAACVECWVIISCSTAWTSTRWCQHTIAACVECWVIISPTLLQWSSLLTCITCCHDTVITYMYIFVNILYSNETIITAIWLALVIDFFDILSSKPPYYKYQVMSAHHRSMCWMLGYNSLFHSMNVYQVMSAHHCSMCWMLGYNFLCWHHLVDVHAVEKEILTQHSTRAVLEYWVHQVVVLAVETELTIQHSNTAAMVVFVNLHYVLSWHCYNIYVYFCKYFICGKIVF